MRLHRFTRSCSKPCFRSSVLSLAIHRAAHPFGFRLRTAMDSARGQVAALIGAQEDEIVFTSCGSESNNLALKGLAFAGEGPRNQIVISAVEHPAVTNAARFLSQHGFSVT